MMMFQALSSLIPLEDLLFAIIAVSVGMYGLSAPSWKHKRPKPRKKCLDKLSMALYLQFSIRLLGIRHHGDKHQDISSKPLGLMLLSISGLNSGLYQPIRVALTRANPGIWEGLKSNTSVSLLFGCKTWWSGWYSLVSHHP